MFFVVISPFLGMASSVVGHYTDRGLNWTIPCAHVALLVAEPRGSMVNSITVRGIHDGKKTKVSYQD
jgi:hypothetical protein